MKVIERPTESVAPTRIAIVGGPGSGKSRLATALPWGARWGERAIYVPLDPGANELSSVLAHNRERLIIVSPEADAKGVYDPYQSLVEIVTHPWHTRFPGCGTIILDTLTLWSQDVLAAVASAQQYAKSPITFGTGIAKHVHPNEGDYGAAQSLVKKVLTFLKNSPLNVIVVFHGQIVEPKDATPGVTFGGPATIGKASVRDIAADFNHVLYLEQGKKVNPAAPTKPTPVYRVYSEQKGVWLAKLRSHHPTNPIPEFDLEPDPVNFWRKFDEVTLTKENTSV